MSKVARLIDDYELTGMGADLEARWTDEEGDRMSLRELADYFNRRLLAAAMEDARMRPVDGEVENTYRLLTAKDVDAGNRTTARRRLEREGVDVESLDHDFVSHQAVYTYLTGERGVESPERGGDPLESSRETLQKLQSRTVAVTENTLERLKRADYMGAGDYDVLVDIRVVDRDTGRQEDVLSLLDQFDEGEASSSD
ncbi:rod-determining factor RdfA [Halomarina litorea]|uniref:rod-determining factor RdfA n=1 Tax=Halomarina litorea TaxID=2961595 RepID=UPI0020C57157|nr:rod-determining factor RdfA [Halomarina sp. BCD28]